MIDDLLFDLDYCSDVLVTFKTKKGHNREMNCTRVLSVVPEDKQDIPDKYIGNDIVAVYDLLNKDWRAFRYDSVITWRINNDH